MKTGVYLAGFCDHLTKGLSEAAKIAACTAARGELTGGISSTAMGRVPPCPSCSHA
ncbi:MAG TPA: hypothetical protein VGP63_16945 [Planctomycetaceae bacterium]|jgi:hypothetical protein|nr:hypothetical protein [Planctomycetaceae bacterium]